MPRRNRRNKEKNIPCNKPCFHAPGRRAVNKFVPVYVTKECINPRCNLPCGPLACPYNYGWDYVNDSYSINL